MISNAIPLRKKKDVLYNENKTRDSASLSRKNKGAAMNPCRRVK